MENAQVFGIPQPQIFVSERTPEGAELTQMDYEVYPQALEHVLRKVAEAFKGDLMVTENGIATARTPAVWRLSDRHWRAYSIASPTASR